MSHSRAVPAPGFISRRLGLTATFYVAALYAAVGLVVPRRATSTPHEASLPVETAERIEKPVLASAGERR